MGIKLLANKGLRTSIIVYKWLETVCVVLENFQLISAPVPLLGVKVHDGLGGVDGEDKGVTSQLPSLSSSHNHCHLSPLSSVTI